MQFLEFAGMFEYLPGQSVAEVVSALSVSSSPRFIQLSRTLLVPPAGFLHFLRPPHQPTLGRGPCPGYHANGGNLSIPGSGAGVL